METQILSSEQVANRSDPYHRSRPSLVPFAVRCTKVPVVQLLKVEL